MCGTGEGRPVQHFVRLVQDLYDCSNAGSIEKYRSATGFPLSRQTIRGSWLCEQRALVRRFGQDTHAGVPNLPKFAQHVLLCKQSVTQQELKNTETRQCPHTFRASWQARWEHLDKWRSKKMPLKHRTKTHCPSFEVLPYTSNSFAGSLSRGRVRTGCRSKLVVSDLLRLPCLLVFRCPRGIKARHGGARQSADALETVHKLSTHCSAVRQGSVGSRLSCKANRSECCKAKNAYFALLIRAYQIIVNQGVFAGL